MGIHFMGQPPFKRILLHGMVVDETGDKMSKVKGNVIDPLDLIQGASFDDVVEKTLPGAPRDEALRKFKKAYPSASQMGSGFAAYGGDALRFTLSTYSPQSKRIPLSPKKIEGYRNFMNKIWNATRFALSYLEGAAVTDRVPPATLLANRWILSRLRAVTDVVRRGIDEFRLDDAALGAYHFFWGELCDWYLELTKPVFAAKESAADLAQETRDVLAYVLEASMRLLHPIIPFITEELWQRLPRPASSPISLALARFPGDEIAARDLDAERDMAALQAVIGAGRSIRSEHDIHPGAEVPLVLRSALPAVRRVLAEETASIQFLVKTKGKPAIEEAGGARPRGAVMHVAADTEVLVSLQGLVDPAHEAARVEREIKKVEKDVAAIEKKLALPSFADKAPPEVVQEAKDQLEALRRKRAALDDARGIAGELASS
jgi:valyl-tRNA synthetase